MLSQTTVGFVGIGKLGLACAEVMSNCYDVTGYDIYPKQSDKIKIADSLPGAVIGKDIIFVAVPTPHDPAYDGSTPITHLPSKDFDYSIVQQTLIDINRLVTKNQLVVLISTVLPGTVRRELRPYITNARFIYNPYLIAMGSVEWDMVNPEMVIIGTDDGSESGDAKQLIDFYRPLMENHPRYVVGTWDEAESIKIFYNTFISAKIGIVNMIQDVAMKVGNIDVDVVTTALAQSNVRIMSPKYMIAGMGDAGPCHPRDNIALRWLANDLNLGYDLFSTIMWAREQQAKNIADYLYALQKETRYTIFIHGQTYKPDVPYMDGSYSTLIGSYLKDLGALFVFIDPSLNTLGSNPSAVEGIVFLAHNAEVTYGYTGESQDQKLYTTLLDGSIVVDPWRKFETTNPNIKVIHYGNSRSK
jgi:UDPglucose 6-dehydrogenase